MSGAPCAGCGHPGPPIHAPTGPCRWAGCPCPGYRARHKYGAQRTACDQGGTAHQHPSRREAARCAELHALQAAGVIRHLELWPRYPLIVNGQRVGVYTGDARYERDGVVVVEDVKAAPTRTEAYQLRKRLVAALYGIVIEEVT